MRVETVKRPIIGSHVTVWKIEDGNKTWGQGGIVQTFVEPTLVILDPIDNLHTYDLTEGYEVEREVEIPITECIQYEEGVCRGKAQHFSPTGLSGPIRCDYHIEKRIESYENSMERYADSDVAPDWFDSSYAGESWNGDD
jgi:hypothetical protein